MTGTSCNVHENLSERAQYHITKIEEQLKQCQITQTKDVKRLHLECILLSFPKNFKIMPDQRETTLIIWNFLM